MLLVMWVSEWVRFNICSTHYRSFQRRSSRQVEVAIDNVGDVFRRFLFISTLILLVLFSQVVQEQMLGEVGTYMAIGLPELVSGISVPKIIKIWLSRFKLQSIMLGILFPDTVYLTVTVIVTVGMKPEANATHAAIATDWPITAVLTCCQNFDAIGWMTRTAFCPQKVLPQKFPEEWDGSAPLWSATLTWWWGLCSEDQKDL